MVRRVAALVALAGAIGLALSGREALPPYLAAFAAAVSVSVGALTIELIARLTEPRWYPGIAPLVQGLAAALPFQALLLVPLALVHPLAFVGRAFAYVATWAVLSLLARRRGAPALGLIVLALTVTFAAFDWIGESEVLGLALWTSGFVAALALACLVPTDEEHAHDLGKLLLTGVAVWLYLAYSQTFVPWIAQLPREQEWFHVRTRETWGPITATVVGAHLVALVLLIPRATKRDRHVLAAIAGALVLVHVLELHVLVVPPLRARPRLEPADLAGLALAGGVTVAAARLPRRAPRAALAAPLAPGAGGVS